MGLVFGSWVTAWVSSGCGFWRGCGLWVVDQRGWVVVVDQRARMKWVVVRGSATEVGRWSLVVGRGWVVVVVGLWLRWLR